MTSAERCCWLMSFWKKNRQAPQKGERFENSSSIIVADTFPIYKPLRLETDGERPLPSWGRQKTLYPNCHSWNGGSLSESVGITGHAEWVEQAAHRANILGGFQKRSNCLMSKINPIFPTLMPGELEGQRSRGPREPGWRKPEGPPAGPV